MKILLIHTGYYPDKDAGAIRVTTFAKMLKNIGHEPIVACYGKFDNYKIETIDGINYVSLIPRFRNFKKSVKELLCNKIIVPDLIWIYWAPFPAFIYLKKYAIKHKILNNLSIDFGGIDFLLLKNGEILFNEFEITAIIISPSTSFPSSSTAKHLSPSPS